MTLGAGETDEPVTCDVKRLIRLPSSLHGKTGLKVVEIDIDELKTFDPLNDAIVFDDDPVKINLNTSFTIKMNQQHFHLEPGEVEVPQYLAVFLIGRRTASII